MSYLKHTVLKAENVQSGFVFSKWHALGLGLFVVLFFVASYFFQKWLQTSPLSPSVVSKSSTEVESFGSMSDWFVSSRGPIIPFRKPPVAAAECMNDPHGPWYYEQGVDGGSSHCTEHCPAPTLPDEDGHCRAGLASA
jgi:hypothetical protein